MLSRPAILMASVSYCDGSRTCQRYGPETSYVRLKLKVNDIAFHVHVYTLEIWDVTFHIVSHNVTRYPTQVNMPRRNSSQTGQYLIYLPWRDGS